MNPQIVVAGVIEQDGYILVAQRKAGILAGKWEFPGGKVLHGEDPKIALAREILEELEVNINVGDCIDEVPFSINNKKCLLVAYSASHISGTYRLSDHKQIAWMRPEDLTTTDLADADIQIAKKVALSHSKRK